ncbi:MAG: hypothetical protein WAM91_12585 [Candidatus Acidiferrales bacterium]
MPHLLVRHKVSDFDQWKRVFDSHAAAQQRAGLKIIHILRNADDPSEVVLFFEAQTIEGARGFVFSPDVPQSKEQSGVTDKPDIYFLT